MAQSGPRRLGRKRPLGGRRHAITDLDPASNFRCQRLLIGQTLGEALPPPQAHSTSLPEPPERDASP